MPEINLSVPDALNLALEEHKAGNIKRADQIYTSILQQYPNHPVASHNLGVLASEFKQFQTAKKLLETALIESMDTLQYWTSYIVLLFEMNLVSKAISMLHEAEQYWQTDDHLLHLEKFKLDLKKRFPDNTTEIQLKTEYAKEPPGNIEQKILALLSSDDKVAASQQVEILQRKYPLSAKLFNLKGTICLLNQKYNEASICFLNATHINPNELKFFLNLAISFVRSDNYKDAVTALRRASVFHPFSKVLHKELLTLYKKENDLEHAIQCAQGALNNIPNDPELLNELGILYYQQGRLPDAIKSYSKAIDHDPKMAYSHHNLGLAYYHQKKLSKAQTSIETALTLDPQYANAMNSLGVIFTDQEKLFEATQLHNLCAEINLKDSDNLENLLSLQLQTSGVSKLEIKNLTTQVPNTPKGMIYSSIYNFITGDLNATYKAINSASNLFETHSPKLTPENYKFCLGYIEYLNALLPEKENSLLDNKTTHLVYHLGESHCLSYAHEHIVLDGLAHRIKPRITLGAKAYHYSKNGLNKYKAITRHNLMDLPHASKVFISFGEIDCRSNEGIIMAALNQNVSDSKIIKSTVKGFVSWFNKENANKEHCLYFLNVPAPVYDERQNHDINIRVARVIEMFNSCLHEEVFMSDHSLLDVYTHSANSNGFSNREFHIDRHHLSPRILRHLKF